MAKQLVPNAFRAGFWRFVRVAVAVIISGVVVKYAHNDWYLLLAPFLSGVFKFLRDKWGIDIVVL